MCWPILLLACTAVTAGTVTQLRSVEYAPLVAEEQQSHDPQYIIGEVIANEFDRHVPVLSDNLRSELNTLRNDISRQFDSLKSHMDLKLERMQRDAPSTVDNYQPETRSRVEIPAAATPAATIRHNLAMAELRRVGADLTRAMNEEVAKLREEFRTSLNNLREQVQNSTDGLATRLENEFSNQAAESTTMLKKVFFLTRNQMLLIQNQLSNITSALHVEEQPTPPPTAPPTDPPTTTTVITTTPEDLPRDCREALLSGRVKSGVTKIRPTEDSEPKSVWCEQEEEGGGWTVVLWRKPQPTQLDFRRTWLDYSEGFGTPDGEYWIGLETLYKLTKGNPYSLRVDMSWEDEEATSVYDYFSVGPLLPGSRGYELNVGGYNKSSTGGDAMDYHNGMEFSTYDQDNDGASGGSCSEWSGGGGWWFNYCYYSNPTGIYPPSDLPPNTQVDHLMEWRKWQGYYTYLSTCRMMIRPN